MQQPQQQQTYTYSTLVPVLACLVSQKLLNHGSLPLFLKGAPAEQETGSPEYTYSTVQGSDADLTTYNAQPVAGGGMTTITGYAAEPKEKWWNVPIGTMHPLDTAGAWNGGSVDSVNQDRTVRMGAPLTLSGEREDGTVASNDVPHGEQYDYARARRRGLRPAQLKGGRLTSLAGVDGAASHATLAAEVQSLSPAEQKKWGRHVLKAAGLHRVLRDLPLSQVKALPPHYRREWARLTEQAAGLAARPARLSAVAKLELSRAQKLSREQERMRAAIARMPRFKAPRRPAFKAPSIWDSSPARTPRVDEFGMPELRGAFSRGVAGGSANLREMAMGLRTDTPCGALCKQRALEAASDAIPV